MPKRLIVDSGFWIGLYDLYDQHHAVANALSEEILDQSIVVPWPTLYEVVNTRFVKHPDWMDHFDRLMRRPNVHRLMDENYRDDSYVTVFSGYRKRPLSLVDVVIRSVIVDVNVPLHALVTFNPGDFVDVCRTRQLEIISGM